MMTALDLSVNAMFAIFWQYLLGGRKFFICLSQKPHTRCYPSGMPQLEIILAMSFSPWPHILKANNDVNDIKLSLTCSSLSIFDL